MINALDSSCPTIPEESEDDIQEQTVDALNNESQLASMCYEHEKLTIQNVGGS